MNLLIIIVNFRTPKLTIDCLRSLAPQVPQVPGTHVAVVENGSGDDSAAQIGQAIAEHGWSAWARLYVSPTNTGFAGGNNWGFAQAEAAVGQARQVLLLNSDTIVHENCVRYCYEKMEADATIGALSCHLRNADGSTQIASRKLPTPLRMTMQSLGLPWTLPGVFGWADTEDLTWDRATVCRDVGWIGGAFLLTRADFYRSTGGLDERFFFYGEDIEFCHRVWKAGLRVVHDPTVSITHLGGASSKPRNEETPMTRINRWRARYLVQRECYGLAAAWWLRSIDIAAHALRRAAMLLTGRRDTQQYQAVRDNLVTLLRPLHR